MEMTIGKRFIITSGSLVVLCISLSAVAIVGFNTVSKHVHSLATDSIPGIVYASALLTDVNALRGDMLRHVATSDHAEMEKLEATISTDIEHVNSDMSSYEAAITSDEDRQNFEKLKPLLAGMSQGWQKVLPLSHASKNGEAYLVYMSEVSPSVIPLRAQLSTMVDWNHKVSDSSLAATTEAVQTSWC